MFNEFLHTAHRFSEQTEPYAIAFVVRREAPTSGKPGDKAIIDKNGNISGWIGGGCTRGIVIKEALASLQDGKPRMVRIHPGGEYESMPGVMSYTMTCQSGGAVELYVEPVLPRPHILILGKSHVAMALCRIAKAMDYAVTVSAKEADLHAFPAADKLLQGDISEESIRPNTCIVVCTQGDSDDLALEHAIRSGAGYVAFVSSRRKAAGIFGDLRQRGIKLDQLKKVKTPAGLDINAKLPEEVAISILAEIIAYLRSEEKQEALAPPPASNANLYINPVCGIPVEKSTAKHVIHYQGEDVFFCCDGCKAKFEAEPEKYMGQLG